MNFIGVDLAWTYKNETGICVINDSGKIIFSKTQRYDDEMLASQVKHFLHQNYLPKPARNLAQEVWSGYTTLYFCQSSFFLLIFCINSLFCNKERAPDNLIFCVFKIKRRTSFDVELQFEMS